MAFMSIDPIRRFVMSQTATEQHPGPEPAMQELARDPASRKRFLKMVGGAGAAGAFSIFLAACGSKSNSGSTAAAPATTATTDMSSTGDLAIVNYALTLEYLESDFYRAVVASGLFKGAQQDTIKRFGEQEQQHVDALTATVTKLGGTPAAKPKTKFPLASAGAVLKLAATVENLGAAAYLGQAGNIQSKEVLGAALSIHTVEARHASALNVLLGKSPTPDGAFAKPASMDEVLPKVKPFIVG
jgi:rubrerythrin